MRIARSAKVLTLDVLAMTAVPMSECTPLRPAATPPSPAATPWLQYATPEAAGFSSAALARAHRYADSVRSGAVMVLHRGVVVAAWGDVARPLELHSVRKSIVSAMFGMAVGAGTISLDRNLGELGISDIVPLTSTEQRARVRDLLAARSGVYLPAAYADAGRDSSRPARGSHAPGQFWYYNNWDFNVLGTMRRRLVAVRRGYGPIGPAAGDGGVRRRQWVSRAGAVAVDASRAHHANVGA